MNRHSVIRNVIRVLWSLVTLSLCVLCLGAEQPDYNLSRFRTGMSKQAVTSNLKRLNHPPLVCANAWTRPDGVKEIRCRTSWEEKAGTNNLSFRFLNDVVVSVHWALPPDLAESTMAKLEQVYGQPTSRTENYKGGVSIVWNSPAGCNKSNPCKGLALDLNPPGLALSPPLEVMLFDGPLSKKFGD